MGRRIASGALNGLEVWISYAVAEYVYTTILPLLSNWAPWFRWEKFIYPSNSMTAVQWKGTLALFAVYALFGVLLGALTGVLVRESDDRREARYRRLLTLSVVVVYGLHSIRSLDASAVPPFLAAAAIAIAVILDLGGKPERQAPAGQPFAVSFALVLSSAAINRFSLPLPGAVLLGVAAGAVVLAASLAIGNVVSLLPSGGRWPPGLGEALGAGLLIGLVFAPDLSSSAPLSAGSLPHPGTARGKPNIVLVTMDTVRADHMGVYGYGRANTPNLQSFAQGATLYSQFTAASSITPTSHASIFTGLYPQSHGAYRIEPNFPKGRPLPAGIPTVAEQLAAAGYRTMAVVANRFYLRPQWGLARGFQSVLVGDPAAVLPAVRSFLLRNAVRHYLLTFDGVAQSLDAFTWNASQVNRRAFHLLDQAAGAPEPFFLFLNYMDAHAPYVVQPPYSDLYSGRDSSVTPDDCSLMEYEVDDLGMPLSTRYRHHFISQYDGAIASLDHHLGMLLAELKNRGLYDNTLIIITSDHGEALGEKGFINHDVSTSQSQVHIPLIIKYPHQTAAERVDTRASHVDLMPTIMEVAGLPVPPAVEGISLLRAKTDTGRVIVAECHSNLDHTSHYRRFEYALFFGTMKFVYSPRGERAVYDLASDPDEKNNLYRADDPTTEALEAKLQQWNRNTRPHFTNAQFPTGKAAKALESLGYLR